MNVIPITAGEDISSGQALVLDVDAGSGTFGKFIKMSSSTLPVKWDVVALDDLLADEEGWGQLDGIIHNVPVPADCVAGQMLFFDASTSDLASGDPIDYIAGGYVFAGYAVLAATGGDVTSVFLRRSPVTEVFTDWFPGTQAFLEDHHFYDALEYGVADLSLYGRLLVKSGSFTWFPLPFGTATVYVRIFYCAPVTTGEAQADVELSVAGIGDIYGDYKDLLSGVAFPAPALTGQRMVVALTFEDMPVSLTEGCIVRLKMTRQVVGGGDIEEVLLIEGAEMFLGGALPAGE